MGHTAKLKIDGEQEEQEQAKQEHEEEQLNGTSKGKKIIRWGDLKRND
ncbi:hypothetical protein JT359_01625 [Candidatus Poribacteria bacterium]|nr:hypothetical protein [Candidatus Poribacteria bacterium]